MSNLFDDVGEFHRKFGLPVAGETHVGIPNFDTVKFRLRFLYEEMDELEIAYANNDLERFADALVDIVYVALGTAHMAGLPFNEHHKIVHEANMKKQRALKPEESKRHSTLDVIKPPGWEPPNHTPILIAAMSAYKVYLNDRDSSK